MSDAAALKDQGNKAFAAKDYNKAIELFSQAIDLDKTNHVLYSNRSAAKAGLKDWAGALQDAEECVKINPKWAKGYARKGAALHGSRRYDDAISAYEAGIAVEDSPALQKGLKEVKDAKEAEEAADPGGLLSQFADPNLIGKLAANPKTKPLLDDPSFVAKVLGVLLGIDMQGFERPEGSNEMPEGFSAAPSSPPQSPPRPSASSSRPAPPPPKEEPKMEVEEEVDPEKKEALELKAKGAEAYKKKDFATAKELFSKAWETWPKDISFLTNAAAAEFEAGDYDAAIATCTKAVEDGRELRADYKLVAKAFGRIGSAYVKKGDLGQAISYFQKSLTEHRTPDILKKLNETEKLKKEQDKKAYIDPELADKAREEGNALFKGGDFAGAVKAYTEAINRAPDDPRGYNNRANAYTKLVALPEALKDAEQAITVDPKFIKARIRKCLILFSMREYTKAMEAAQEATDFDEDKKHTAEIESLMQKCAAALYAERSQETEEQALARAMKDPEVGQIMSDPIMQSILQQAQQDPASLADHMKNPMIAQKIRKLIAAGIIKTR
ncbi:Hsp90 cochaperone [Tulasnella sp. 424]|nr:Hsp90 cochaperone [Tulasnella sp. 424]